MTKSASQAAAFYREVAANQKLWTIRDAGGIPTPSNSDGQRAMPFWSSVSRVQSFVASVSAYAAFEPVEMPWRDFTSRWAPGLERDELRVGVNWSGERATGFDVAPADVVRNVESAHLRHNTP